MTTPIFRKRGIDTSNTKAMREFKALVYLCLSIARDLYPEFHMRDSELPVVFFKSGKTAGWAKRRGSNYNIEFNTHALTTEWDDMVNNVIPHEVAHIVDMYLNGNSDHGHRWASICRALGGNASRTHSYDMRAVARKTTKHLYRATCGTEVQLGARRHANIQRGAAYGLRGGGKINKDGYIRRVA